MTVTKQEGVLRVRVRCTELPGRRFQDAMDPANPCKEPVLLGIQKGQEVIDAVFADRREATFVAEFRVGEKKDGSPNFLGPYAQGNADDRFFYLAWGVKTETGPFAPFAMFRRLKIRLGHLKWKEIRASIAAGKPLAVSLRCTDAKGGPLCATPPSAHLEWDLASRAASPLRRARRVLTRRAGPSSASRRGRRRPRPRS